MCSPLCVILILIIITTTSLVSFCLPTLFGVSCQDNLKIGVLKVPRGQKYVWEVGEETLGTAMFMLLLSKIR